MRKFSVAAAAMILAIAFYFTLFWGLDGLHMLSSPAYGLDEVWRSQFVFAIGRLFELTPIGLLKLAAFFATLKLVVAAICAVHIIDRLRNFASGKVNYEIFEAGLMLVVLISVASVGPAVWSHNADLVREQTIQLLLAAVAAGLGIVEHRNARAKATAVPVDRTAPRAAVPEGATRFSPLRR